MAGTKGITPKALQGSGKTLLGISRTTGLDQGYLSRVFAGKQRPSIVTAQRIAAACGWDLGVLIAKLDLQRESADVRLINGN
jgi:transcriptional regulator with XRE-family HTH domain